MVPVLLWVPFRKDLSSSLSAFHTSSGCWTGTVSQFEVSTKTFPHPWFKSWSHEVMVPLKKQLCHPLEKICKGGVVNTTIKQNQELQNITQMSWKTIHITYEQKIMENKESSSEKGWTCSNYSSICKNKKNVRPKTSKSGIGSPSRQMQKIIHFDMAMILG